MDREAIIQKFETLNLWQRAGERAPHKPLLVLYAIRRLLLDGVRLIPYSEIDENLGRLLKEFGPRRSRHGTQYPFWRLRNDNVWEVTDAHKLSQTPVEMSERGISLVTTLLVASMKPLPSNFRMIRD